MRITNITPIYEKDGTIIEYRISIDNYVQGGSLNANLVIGGKDIDINYILDVCKNNLNSFLG